MKSKIDLASCLAEIPDRRRDAPWSAFAVEFACMNCAPSDALPSRGCPKSHP